ncbi:hypothetical protein B0H19DRAFT_1055983 [Mycena capillaripes]|nr:hypothetical protein B0H19DRAFT_1055983 [Mycena capillaripes]
MSFASLPAGLRYEVLSYLPNFHDLNSLISTSRSFHTVFLAHRDLILKHVAENFFGLALGEEIIGDFEQETGASTVVRSIKLLLHAREAVENLEPLVFRLLLEEDAHWDEPDRCPSSAESTRLRRAAYRFATFCGLSSGLQQSRFLARLETIEVFELVHFVDGLRKMISIMLDSFGGRGDDDSDAGQVSCLVSTGPATIFRLWTMRPQAGDDDALAKFCDESKTTARTGDAYDGDGAFDDAFHHFEISRNLSAFDATRTRALLDVGHQQTQEALLQLECLMVPPPPTPPSRPRRPRFRSLKLPLCDNSNKKSVRLPFLPDHLNSLPVPTHIPYAMLVLNGEPRIMPLSLRQLAELVNSMHL